MAALWGGPTRLLLLLAAAAAAGAAAGAAFRPFPAPSNTSLGSFHRLPALGCDMAAPGRVGPPGGSS